MPAMATEEPTPEQDAALADQAFQSGDLSHAAFHVTAALAANPLHPQWRGLFDKIIAAAPEPLRLLHVEDGAYFAHVAGHAYILAGVDQLDEAFNLLCQVISHRPDLGYYFWVSEWLARCRDRSLELGPFLHLLSDLTRPTVGRLRLRPAERFALSGAVAVVRELVQTPNGATSAPVLGLSSGILRRAGLADEAVALARRSLELEQNPGGAISLGLGCRQLGDSAGAEEAFRHALSFDPDPVYHMELARTLWEGGELERALAELETYHQTLDHEDPECELTAAYLRYRLHGEEEGRWIAEAVGERVLPDDVRQLMQPYVGFLPEFTDATVNILRQLYQQTGHVTDGSVQLTVSHVEAPSARLALALMTRGTTDPAAVDYRFDKAPQPDPRKARRPVEVQLWHYGGLTKKTPRQVVLPPDPAVLARVEIIAASGYYLPRWWREAGALATDLGVEAEPALLGAMVFPSMPPAGMPGFVWIQRLQHAAALVLARLDGGWSDSRRRTVLLSLVNGVMDWTVDAAIVALTELALDEPAALTEVAELFVQLLDDIPNEGHTWYGETLGHNALRLPARPPDERERFVAFLESLEEEEERPDSN
jgi:tetratricopeptide (TPR) repeat protein